MEWSPCQGKELRPHVFAVYVCLHVHCSILGLCSYMCINHLYYVRHEYIYTMKIQSWMPSTKPATTVFKIRSKSLLARMYQKTSW